MDILNNLDEKIKEAQQALEDSQRLFQSNIKNIPEGELKEKLKLLMKQAQKGEDKEAIISTLKKILQNANIYNSI